MAVDLHTTPTVTNLTVAVYMLAMSIFPLWWYVSSTPTPLFSLTKKRVLQKR